VDRGSYRLAGSPVHPDCPPLRTIQIQAGDHIITAADPLPEDLHDAIDAISSTPRGAHYFGRSQEASRHRPDTARLPGTSDSLNVADHALDGDPGGGVPRGSAESVDTLSRLILPVVPLLVAAM
jgi:hypothetical protein